MYPPPTLSSDLVYEILSRVSLGTLEACRVVSRQWNQITYEPTLVALRSQRTETLHGYMVRWYKGVNQTATFVSTVILPDNKEENDNGDSLISIDFLRPFGGSVKMEAAHHGIILCLRNNPRNYYVPQYIVSKPSTKQWVVIPNPKTRNLTVAIDLVVLRSQPVLHYKILRVSECRLSTNNYTSAAFHCEVFNSKTWKWKKLDDIKLPKEYSMCCYIGSKVTISSITCVLTKHPDGIFMFDVMEEAWITLPLPFDKVDNYEWIELMNVKGKLGVLRRDTNDGELWLMEDRRNNIWRRTEYKVTTEDPEEVKSNHYFRHVRSATMIFPFECDFELTNLGGPL